MAEGKSSKKMEKGIESWQDDRVRNNELKEMEVADKLGGQDMYIDSEKDTDWYHWTGSRSSARPKDVLGGLCDLYYYLGSVSNDL